MSHSRDNRIRGSTIAMKTVNKSIGSDAKVLIVGTKVSGARNITIVCNITVYILRLLFVYIEPVPCSTVFSY